jgi:hypothetical protein
MISTSVLIKSSRGGGLSGNQANQRIDRERRGSNAQFEGLPFWPATQCHQIIGCERRDRAVPDDPCSMPNAMPPSEDTD